MARVRSRLSRRNMLIGLAGGAAATAGTIATNGFTESASFANLLRPVRGGRRGVPLQYANYADWSAQVGSYFSAHSGHVLKLVNVGGFMNRGPRPSNVRNPGFVARFDVSKGGDLGEGIYRVAHREGGTFDVFLTKGSADKPLRMLAVFG